MPDAQRDKAEKNGNADQRGQLVSSHSPPHSRTEIGCQLLIAKTMNATSRMIQRNVFRRHLRLLVGARWCKVSCKHVVSRLSKRTVPEWLGCEDCYTNGAAVSVPNGASQARDTMGGKGDLPEHPLEDRVDLPKMIGEVELLFELGGQCGGDLGIGLQQFEQRQRAVGFPHLHRVALDQAIAVFAADPGLRQRQQHPLRVDEAAHLIQILLHPLG